MQSISQTFRAHAIEAMRPHKNSVILLSGGIDSGTMLAAALELGYKPTLATFRLSGYESTDFKVSKAMAEYFKLPFIPVIVPQETESLIHDIKRVMRIIKLSQKTHIQCCHPMLYVVDEIKRNRFETALWASTLDFLFGSSRKAQIAQHQHGHDEFTKFRVAALNDPNPSDRSIEKIFTDGETTLIDSFNYAPLISFMLGLTFEQMHKPKQKQIAISAFSSFWKSSAWYRKHDSYQVNSGLRSFHDTLLNHPINTHQHRAIIGIYNNLLREVTNE